MVNLGFDDELLEDGIARLTYDAGAATAGSHARPRIPRSRRPVRMRAVSIIPREATPVSLRLEPPWDSLGGISYHFH